MGVWHLSGMGLYPGAVTVPLTYVYLLLAFAMKGDEEARKFFATSGEMGQTFVGAPECVVIFTSREMITGKTNGESFQRWENIKKETGSDWFNIHVKGTAPEAIAEYLSALLEELGKNGFKRPYGDEWIKRIYFVQVKHQDFDDCFLKVGVTLKALHDKEVWINMIGGTNQINISLLLAGSLFAVPARYYYIFQSNHNLLNPEIPKSNIRNKSISRELISRWQELPIFQLDIGPLLRELDSKFKERDSINIRELEKALERFEMSRQYIAKLRGRIVNIEKDRVSKGPLFNRLVGMKDRIDEESRNVKDVPSWREWASGKGILWEMSSYGGLEHVGPSKQ